MDLIEVSNSAELWEQFEQTAKLDDTFYDEALKEDIFRELEISPISGDIKEQLVERSVSTERLLTAILTSMQPFSKMLEELLFLFDRIGVRKSDGGLRIEFDFDEGNRLGLDLDRFRQDVVRASRCTHHVSLPLNPWSFSQRLQGELQRQPFWSDVVRLDFFGNEGPYRDIFRWVIWRRGIQWPSYSDNTQGDNTNYQRRLPKCPHSGNSILDTRLEVLWEFAEVAWIHYFEIHSSNDSREYCEAKDPLYQAETDRWSERIVRLVTEIANYSSSIDTSVRNTLAEKVSGIIDAALSQFGSGTDISVSVDLEQLKTLLELPYWKRRHELYSAWVLTQIDKALEGTGTHFFVRDGVLSFSFKGVCLAECGLLSPSPFIYAELRSKLNNPIGPGRRHGIQPDYTIAVQPALEPDNALAVVECKQYKRANRKAFEAAIVDYANGRPQALVSLVDYGKVPRRSTLPTSIQPRTAMYGPMRPGTEEALRFRDDLRAAIRAYYRNRAYTGDACTTPWKEPRAGCSIRLSWNSSPRDLDLHVQIADMSIGACDEEVRAINYRSLNHPKGQKYGRLHGDQQVGPGSETFQVAEWYPEERYDVFVVNYSGEVAIEGNVVVTIQCGKTEVTTVKRDKWEAGMAWHVFRLSGFGLQVMNQMQEQAIR